MQQMQQPWLLLLYLWGMQWIASGILDFFNEGSILKTIKLISFLIACAASLLILYKFRSQVSVASQRNQQIWRSYTLLFPLFILIGGFILLWFISSADSLLILHVLRVLILAFIYVLIGAIGASELIWLGYWLFALIVIVSVWYLGYAPFVFEGMGGLSLLAGGWVLRNKHLQKL